MAETRNDSRQRKGKLDRRQVMKMGMGAVSQHSATKVGPLFKVDPSFPTMPNGWIFGQVSSAAADAQGNIWVLHRPKTVRTGETIQVIA